MHSRKPLPVSVLVPKSKGDDGLSNRPLAGGTDGIVLGDGCRWNPSSLPNGHIVLLGASGSGKTQTLKAIAYELHRTYEKMQVILIDFHGDQKVLGETVYPLHMAQYFLVKG